MCTAVSYPAKDFYFGRTLDYERSFGEQICLMPRGFPLSLRHLPALHAHLAVLGMAHVADGYPLFYDAMNETGLCAAGLNFPLSAAYARPAEGKINVAAFELIAWLLASCKDLAAVRAALRTLNLVDTPFSGQLPPSPLHWLIADAGGTVVLEAMADGLHVYENPVGVLTNEPPFPMQLFNLNNYAALSAGQPENHFSAALPLRLYSRGMGALGLPGDLSSASRFVRAAFTRLNTVCGASEAECVSQFFHILASVRQVRGCCEVEPGLFEFTRYTSCCNASRGIYYYTTYENHQISAVCMHRENLAASKLICYPLLQKANIHAQN